MLRITSFRNVLLIGLLSLLIRSSAVSVAAGINDWTSNGPEGGSIQALAIDPATPTTLYVGAFGGGYWITWFGYQNFFLTAAVLTLLGAAYFGYFARTPRKGVATASTD